MQHDDPVRALLHGLERPAPPPELEARTLAAAGAALRDVREADVWERVWSSRPLRLIWATSLLALLAAHVALSMRAALEGGARPTPAAARAELPAELRRIAELPPITLSGAWDLADEPGREPATPPSNRTEIRR